MWHIIPLSKLTVAYFRRLSNVGVSQRLRRRSIAGCRRLYALELAKWAATLGLSDDAPQVGLAAAHALRDQPGLFS